MHIVDFFSWKFFFSLNIMCGSRNIYAPIVIRRLCSKVWEHKIITLFLMRGHQSVKKCPYSEFSGLYFPAPGLNMERYGVSLWCIQSKCGQIRTRKTPNTDTFHPVHLSYYSFYNFFMTYTQVSTCNSKFLIF